MISRKLYIPQELTDHIVGLVGSGRTLKACALVHSRWLKASQIHLFRGTTIDSLNNGGKGGIRTFSAFIYSSPHLKPFIQAVNITINSGVYGLDVLIAILQRLPALTRLNILGDLFICPTPPLAEDAPRFKLQRLSCSELGHRSESEGDFLRFLHVFSSVDVLDLSLLNFTPLFPTIEAPVEDTYDLLDSDLPTHLTINSIRMYQMETSFQVLFLGVLREIQAVNTLSSIEVDCYFPEEHNPLFNLTQAIGSNLLDLSITVLNCQEAPERLLWMEAISKISHCTSLRSLKVNVDTLMKHSGLFEESSWCRLLEFLEVTPTSVSRITIEYDYSFDEFSSSSENMVWDRLDEMLCRREKLESVVFEFWESNLKSCHQGVATVVTFLRNGLPKTQSSGVEICACKR